MSNEKKILPELRFPEFLNEGEWVTKKLGEIGEPLMCKRVLKEQTTSNPKNSIPFYKIGTFGKDPDAYIPIELYEEFKNKYSFPQKGDILISAAGTIGRLVVYNGLPAYFQDSNIVWLGNDESMVLNSFLFHYYSIIKWQTSDGGIISRLYNSDLKNINISYSKNTLEQQKIASCLSSLDEVITAHSQKLELLKVHKKGLMQNLFPQEGEKVPKLRFREFENDGEWVEKKLGEVAENIMYGMNASATVFDGENIYLRITDIDENTRLISRNSLTSPNGILEDKYLLKVGDLVFARTGASVGKSYLHQNDAGKVYFAGFLIRFSITEYIPYFIYAQTLTEQYQKWVSKTSMRSGQPGINAEEYKLYTFFTPPTIQEQKKIASCLSSLDALIAAQAEKIEQLKMHKKGLMQGLFPVVNDKTPSNSMELEFGANTACNQA